MRWKWKRLGISTVVVGLLAALTVGCGQQQGAAPAGAGGNKTLKDVTVRLDWTPWALHTFLYTAQAKGYFAQEGLNVKLYAPSNPEDTLKIVGAGKDTFGISYQTDVLMARSQQVPVVSFAALVQHPLNVLMVRQDGSIRTPADLAGKNVGTSGIPTYEAMLRTVLQSAGVDSQQVKVSNVGFDLVPALAEKKVDGIIGGFVSWEKILLEQQHVPVKVFRLTDYGVPDYYELVLITNEDTMKHDPDTVKAFWRAAEKGMNDTLQHPDEAIGYLLAQNKDLDKNLARQSLQTLLPMMTEGGFGHQSAARWQAVEQWMEKEKLLQSPVDITQAFTEMK